LFLDIVNGDNNDNPFASEDELKAYLDENTSFSRAPASGAMVSISKNELGYDAWGRPKVVNDVSIFHGMFTYNVPVSTWYELYNQVEQPISNSTSVDGELVIQAGATMSDNTILTTYRNLRYEPNRGFLYSTSAFFNNPSASMAREFGVGTVESGVTFSLQMGVLYGIVRTKIGGVNIETAKIELDTTDVDLSKGNTYDIQFQWRGVGDYKWFINLKEVGSVENLGVLDNLSMFNPALPAVFFSQNLGDNDIMRFGCVDITSEGGLNDGKTYGSVGISTESGEAAFSGWNQPILAVRSKKNVGIHINTRDAKALSATFYSDEKSICRIWATRDFTAITEGNSAWADYSDGHMESIQMTETAGTMSFDTAKATLIWTGRVAKENSIETGAVFNGEVAIHLTPGDMFVFTQHRETGAGTKGGVTFEFGEEI
jgi:hypothetical protein